MGRLISFFGGEEGVYMEEAPLKKNYICMSRILSRTAQVDCITA